MRQLSKGHRDEPPILLVKWYDVTKWMLERVDSFPKNQQVGRAQPDVFTHDTGAAGGARPTDYCNSARWCSVPPRLNPRWRDGSPATLPCEELDGSPGRVSVALPPAEAGQSTS